MTESAKSNPAAPAGPVPAAPRFTMPDGSAGWRLAERAAWRLLEKAAVDVVILDMRGRSDVCDFFVLASGRSDTQVRALAKWVRDTMLDDGQKARGAEGMDDGSWALLDFFDVVVHVFHERTREYFQLERLWGDAARLDVEPAWFAANGAAERHPDLKFTTAAPGGADRE